MCKLLSSFAGTNELLLNFDSDVEHKRQELTNKEQIKPKIQFFFTESAINFFGSADQENLSMDYYIIVLQTGMKTIMSYLNTQQSRK